MTIDPIPSGLSSTTADNLLPPAALAPKILRLTDDAIARFQQTMSINAPIFDAIIKAVEAPMATETPVATVKTRVHEIETTPKAVEVPTTATVTPSKAMEVPTAATETTPKTVEMPATATVTPSMVGRAYPPSEASRASGGYGGASMMPPTAAVSSKPPYQATHCEREFEIASTEAPAATVKTQVHEIETTPKPVEVPTTATVTPSKAMEVPTAATVTAPKAVEVPTTATVTTPKTMEVPTPATVTTPKTVEVPTVAAETPSMVGRAASMMPPTAAVSSKPPYQATHCEREFEIASTEAPAATVTTQVHATATTPKTVEVPTAATVTPSKAMEVPTVATETPSMVGRAYPPSEASRASGGYGGASMMPPTAAVSSKPPYQATHSERELEIASTEAPAATAKTPVHATVTAPKTMEVPTPVAETPSKTVEVPTVATETPSMVGRAASMMPPTAAVSSKPPYQATHSEREFEIASTEAPAATVKTPVHATVTAPKTVEMPTVVDKTAPAAGSPAAVDEESTEVVVSALPSEVLPPQTTDTAAAAPVMVPEAIAAAAARAATVRSQEIASAVETVAATVAVTPGLVQGDGEVRIVLKSTVLDGSEVKIEARGQTLQVSLTPATDDVAQVVERSLPQFQQQLAERISAFHRVSVVITPRPSRSRLRSST